MELEGFIEKICAVYDEIRQGSRFRPANEQRASALYGRNQVHIMMEAMAVAVFELLGAVGTAGAEDAAKVIKGMNKGEMKRLQSAEGSVVYLKTQFEELKKIMDAIPEEGGDE